MKCFDLKKAAEQIYDFKPKENNAIIMVKPLLFTRLMCFCFHCGRKIKYNFKLSDITGFLLILEMYSYLIVNNLYV
jgi:hypothetical protein